MFYYYHYTIGYNAVAVEIDMHSDSDTDSETESISSSMYSFSDLLSDIEDDTDDDVHHIDLANIDDEYVDHLILDTASESESELDTYTDTEYTE
jgi:hypothetical protein